MLKNPFYCGMMDTKKGVFPHHYEPIVSKNLFEAVQSVFHGYHKKPHQALAKPFIFRGLITCAHCGCVVSPETKKEKYTYYSCSNSKQNCKRVYVREEVLLETVASYFRSIVLPDDIIQEITEDLKKLKRQKALSIESI